MLLWHQKSTSFIGSLSIFTYSLFTIHSSLKIGVDFWEATDRYKRMHCKNAKRQKKVRTDPPPIVGERIVLLFLPTSVFCLQDFRHFFGGFSAAGCKP